MGKTRSGRIVRRLLSFDVILSASKEDVDAINEILKHYRGYMFTLATRRLYDEQGNVILVLDKELYQELEAKLTAKIFSFVLM